MKCLIYIVLIVIINAHLLPAFENDNEWKDVHYENACSKLISMLDGTDSLNFKKAVFLIENAYHGDSLNFDNYCSHFTTIKTKLKKYMDSKGIRGQEMAPYYAVWSYMCEPSPMNNSKTCSYDFNDFMGSEDWTNQFITKLIKTKKGNCHSLPFYFKILTEEMGVSSYLAAAPSHFYIKHQIESGQWVNIELTNGGSFSTDAWIMSSMGINSEAIRNGTYMAPLSLQESVALCLYDLAMGYKVKYGHNEEVEKMCEKVLQYYPKCIMALMLKADCIAVAGKELKKIKDSNILLSSLFDVKKDEHIKISNRIIELGHREMTAEEYENWAREMDAEVQKQANNTVNKSNELKPDN